jgi:hypothetical protein
MLGGLLPAVPKLFVGHVAGLLPALSALTFTLLFFGLPAALVICNAAAYQRGGRRLRRCVAVSAILVGGLLVAWWFAHSAPPAHGVFHRDGRITISSAATRVHGLLSCAASVAMFCLTAWMLLRPSRHLSVRTTDE